MARRRQRRSTRTFRRGRRRPCDILPFSLCQTGLSVPVPDPDADYTCITPFTQEFLLIDGAALDSALIGALSGGGEGIQSVNRGVTFLGMTMDHVFSLRDDPNNFLTNVDGIHSLDLACAVMVRQWDYVDGNLQAPRLPNLFSMDEREVNGVLHRWHVHLAPIVQYSGDKPEYVAQTNYVDSRGGWANIVSTTGDPVTALVAGGSGSGNTGHINIRNKRRLDEEHYLSLIVSLRTSWIGLQEDSFSVLLDATGLIKAKNLA